MIDSTSKIRGILLENKNQRGKWFSRYNDKKDNFKHIPFSVFKMIKLFLERLSIHCQPNITMTLLCEGPVYINHIKVQY